MINIGIQIGKRLAGGKGGEKVCSVWALNGKPLTYFNKFLCVKNKRVFSIKDKK